MAFSNPHPICRIPLFRAILGLLTLASAGKSVWADDAAITLQTTLSDSYGRTNPLSAARLAKDDIKIDVTANTDDKDAIRRVLTQLKDGDVLVLAVHSNQNVFAIGNHTVAWSDFWSYFDISRPPRLGMVVIGGCMARKLKKDQYVPASPEEVLAIQRALNTRSLLVPKGTVWPLAALNTTYKILTLRRAALKGGKGFSLADITVRNWHTVEDGEAEWEVDKNAAIHGYNVQTLQPISLEAAKAHCIKGGYKSFDYERAVQRAFFHRVNKDTIKLKRDYRNNPYDHYTLRRK